MNLESIPTPTLFKEEPIAIFENELFTIPSCHVEPTSEERRVTYNSEERKQTNNSEERKPTNNSEDRRSHQEIVRPAEA
jgi:hypothetical protein